MIPMSTSSDELARQVAALEEALKLPLPDASRRQLEQQLSELRAQQAATPTAGIHGTVNVPGTLHGSAIGVNLGTVQSYYGTAPGAVGAQPAASVSQEEINDQRELLDAHRRTLAVYLKQRAQLSSAYTPPNVEHGIREARAAIRRIKATLQGWGAPAADHPDDEDAA
jgi:hypothetical protein